MCADREVHGSNSHTSSEAQSKGQRATKYEQSRHDAATQCNWRLLHRGLGCASGVAAATGVCTAEWARTAQGAHDVAAGVRHSVEATTPAGRAQHGRAVQGGGSRPTCPRAELLFTDPHLHTWQPTSSGGTAHTLKSKYRARASHLAAAAATRRE